MIGEFSTKEMGMHWCEKIMHTHLLIFRDIDDIIYESNIVLELHW